jgi:hypothetical protein
LKLEDILAAGYEMKAAEKEVGEFMMKRIPFLGILNLIG